MLVALPPPRIAEDTVERAPAAPEVTTLATLCVCRTANSDSSLQIRTSAHV